MWERDFDFYVRFRAHIKNIYLDFANVSTTDLWLPFFVVPFFFLLTFFCKWVENCCTLCKTDCRSPTDVKVKNKNKKKRTKKHHAKHTHTHIESVSSSPSLQPSHILTTAPHIKTLHFDWIVSGKMGKNKELQNEIKIKLQK